jgi:endonuclease-3
MKQVFITTPLPHHLTTPSSPRQFRKGVTMAMPATTNKQRLLNTLFATLKKHYDDPGDPPERPVLEQMVYAVLREDATRADADRAFKALQARFFDWNEVRVSSPHEVEEAFAGLPQPGQRAQRVISLLQEVFESTFSFDLEGLHKKGLKQAGKQVGRYQAANDYTVAWVTQQALGGHAIPVDAPTLRVSRRLGLLDGEADDPESARASLEHQVPKARGPLFGDYASLLARDYCWEEDPNCAACPLRGECLTGTTDARCQGTGRPGRPKPR